MNDNTGTLYSFGNLKVDEINSQIYIKKRITTQITPNLPVSSLKAFVAGPVRCVVLLALSINVEQYIYIYRISVLNNLPTKYVSTVEI